MENIDLSAITEVFGKIGDWLASVNWEEVFNTVKDVITKIVDFVSGLAA